MVDDRRGAEGDPLDPARASERRDLHGGEGRVREWDLGGATEPFTAVLVCELEAGGRVGEHRQETDDAVILVLAGTGTLWVDAIATGAIPGTAVAVPLGAALAIDNRSDVEPLRYALVKARRPGAAPVRRRRRTGVREREG